jgi:hypothetical protein
MGVALKTAVDAHDYSGSVTVGCPVWAEVKRGPWHEGPDYPSGHHHWLAARAILAELLLALSKKPRFFM